MTEYFGRDGFDEQIGALEDAMGGAAAVAATLTREMRSIEVTVADAGREIANMRRGISGGLRRAIDGLVFDGDKLSDALRNLGRSMVDAAYSAALKPATDHVGGLLATGVEGLITGLLPFGAGASFSQGRVRPFASGGVVTGPTGFAMRGGGWGLMGEAGPEAIMPLARGADGRLGVRAEAPARPVSVVINISTPDVEGFRRSQGQIAAQMTRVLGRGQRNR